MTRPRMQRRKQRPTKHMPDPTPTETDIDKAQEEALALAGKVAEKPRRRGRPSRAQEERHARRMREGIVDGHKKRLHVPEEDKEPGMAYRWVNEPRVPLLTTGLGDWDVDPDTEPRHVGFDYRSGNPMQARLVRKPQEWLEEDRARAQAALDRTEPLANARKGDPVALGEGNDKATGYVASTPVAKR